MRIPKLLAGLPLLLLHACSQPAGAPATSDLINTAHLEHLYKEIVMDSTRIGAIWIYCEAPDYVLIGDEDEGFTCVDDVARALVFYCRQQKITPAPENLEKIRALTEFLLHLRAENDYFYNFLLPDKQINKTHQNSLPIAGWWSWRAFWALSELQLLESDELVALQNRTLPVMDALFSRIETLCVSSGDPLLFDGVSIPHCLTEVGADQMGVLMIGLSNYYQKKSAESVKTVLLRFGNLLQQVQLGDAQTFPHYAFMSWRNNWHGWGNAQAYALLRAGRILKHNPFITAGLREVNYFYPYCLEQGFMHEFKVVNPGDSLERQDYQQFSQIAYDIRPMVYAAQEAYSITGDTTYAVTAGRLAGWFFGNNPAGQQMYDPASGRCFDGISSPDHVNYNSGAESTIEALLSLQAISDSPVARAALNPFLKKKNEKLPIR